jgi:hypothetical protein
MFRRGPATAFFAGTVLCGSAYLMLVNLGNTCSLLIADRFLRIAAEWAYSDWPSPPPPMAPVAVQARYQESHNSDLANWNGIEPRSVFAGVGHLLFSWLFAMGGGLVARAFAARDS